MKLLEGEDKKMALIQLRAEGYILTRAAAVDKLKRDGYVVYKPGRFARKKPKLVGEDREEAIRQLHMEGLIFSKWGAINKLRTEGYIITKSPIMNRILSRRATRTVFLALLALNAVALFLFH